MKVNSSFRRGQVRSDVILVGGIILGLLSALGGLLISKNQTEKKYLATTTPEQRELDLRIADELLTLQIGEFIEYRGGFFAMVAREPRDRTLMLRDRPLDIVDREAYIPTEARTVKRIYRFGDPDFPWAQAQWLPQPPRPPTPLEVKSK
jgi:hypothetical protein